jgi:hypothetical protein
MPARLLQIMLLIALLFAPICMSGGGAAIAAPDSGNAGEQQAPHAGHCAEMGEEGEDEQDGDVDLDCRTTCSGVLAQVPVLHGSPADVRERLKAAPVSAAPGMNPAAEPRPPQLS